MVSNKKLLSKLSQNLLEILEDDEYYDITIEVGKDPYTKVFRSHMVILHYRSPYLRRILSTIKKNDDGSLAHIKLPNILPEVFQIILSYIYGGTLSLETYDTLDIIKILEAADKFGLQELIAYLQAYLIEDRVNWMEQNFNLINRTSFEHNSFLVLQKFCADLISNEPVKIFKSLDFFSVSEKSLVSLLQNDNLQMSEVQVWEYVLKWGLAQNPELPSDPSDYSKDDFNSLKNTLQQYIPFIRLYNLTCAEFLDKVHPYRKVIPKELREDLVKYFLNPQSDKSRPRGVKIDSKIISNRHVELISRWIDNIGTSKNSSTSYEFKLLLRGSRDGLTGDKFHEICDNQSRTVSVIKVKGSDEILGGYNPIEWKSRNLFQHIDNELYGVTRGSFIFSFKDRQNIDNYILSRVNDATKAINNWSINGPSFGWDLITFSSLGSYCKKQHYEKQIRGTDDYFHIEECEVFQIFKHDI